EPEQPHSSSSPLAGSSLHKMTNHHQRPAAKSFSKRGWLVHANMLLGWILIATPEVNLSRWLKKREHQAVSADQFEPALKSGKSNLWRRYPTKLGRKSNGNCDFMTASSYYIL